MMDKINILWINGDALTAHTMVFMYAVNAKTRGWWKNVDVIIWGPAAKIAAEDTGIQERIKLAQQAGVNVLACIACATQLGVVEKLRALNITVKAMGEPLTEILKNNEKLITI